MDHLHINSQIQLGCTNFGIVNKSLRHIALWSNLNNTNILQMQRYNHPVCDHVRSLSTIRPDSANSWSSSVRRFIQKLSRRLFWEHTTRPYLHILKTSGEISDGGPSIDVQFMPSLKIPFLPQIQFCLLQAQNPLRGISCSYQLISVLSRVKWSQQFRHGHNESRPQMSKV